MIQTKSLIELSEPDAAWAGSKAVRLGRLGQAGYRVPAGIAIGADAYSRFVESTDILTSIQLMLQRKEFEDMRWEEIWDLALRVRNLFGRTALPADLQAELEKALTGSLPEGPVVVRSAGLSEDSQAASFAGLHDSFINVSGIEQILEKIVLVWASLWSDRALLYRQELGLDPRQSRIAVIVQQFVLGDASGVSFSRSPHEPGELLIEAVWGLNQGMVDGTVPPHRWHLDRKSGQVTRAVPVEQSQALRATAFDARLVELTLPEKGTPPLQESQLRELSGMVLEIEDLFGAPQDVEWTLANSDLVMLQSRPITTGVDPGDDKRSWYLTLHRSIDNLETLRGTIQNEVLPGMEREAQELGAVDLAALNEAALISEIRHRKAVRDRWVDAYWEHCIPFAHGMRIFGQVYNDSCKPEDPFEFVSLLRNDALLGVQRNAEMRKLARHLKDVSAGLKDQESFDRRLDAFLVRFGLTSVAGRPQDRQGLLALIARLPEVDPKPGAEADLPQRFLERFSGEERAAMAELLGLARDSYSLRDDDNIYLERIEAQLIRAVREGSRRIGENTSGPGGSRSAAELVHLLEDPAFVSANDEAPQEASGEVRPYTLRARQLVGQPASPGLAVGTARVILDQSELLSFREGEVLVCDALDPTMTFVAPLAAGVIERRGGMLIHGAIIAREYGIPCVTGVPDVTSWIRTGDAITLDGHLGLVTVSARASVQRESVRRVQA